MRHDSDKFTVVVGDGWGIRRFQGTVLCFGALFLFLGSSLVVVPPCEGADQMVEEMIEASTLEMMLDSEPPSAGESNLTTVPADDRTEEINDTLPLQTYVASGPRVEGWATYLDYDNIPKPCRFIRVDLREDEWGGDENLAQTWTDANGYYCFSGTNDQFGDKDVFVRFMAESKWAHVLDDDVLDPADTYEFSTETRHLDNSGYINFGSKQPSAKDGVPFALVDRVTHMREWIESKTGWQRLTENIRKVVIKYPAPEDLPGWTATSHIHIDEYWNVFPLLQYWEEIHLSPRIGGDNWANFDNLIQSLYHEYAHWICYCKWGNWMPEDWGRDTHSFGTERSEEFAIGEGIAEFFEYAVAGYVHIGGTDVEDNRWFDSNDIGDWDGFSVEGSIASVLWDITDPVDPADGADGDYIQANLTWVWKCLFSDRSSSFRDFYNRWHDPRIVPQDVIWDTYEGLYYTFRNYRCDVSTPMPIAKITNLVTARWYGGQIPIVAEVKDIAGVSCVDFFLNGQYLSTDSNGSDGWSSVWNSTGYVSSWNWNPDFAGLAVLGAAPKDLKGATGITWSVRIRVDQEDPSLSVSYKPDSPTELDKLRFTIEASDDVVLAVITFFYRIGPFPEDTGELAWTNQPLYQHLPGGMTVVLGPFPNCTVVYYYVLARDLAWNTTIVGYSDIAELPPEEQYSRVVVGESSPSASFSLSPSSGNLTTQFLVDASGSSDAIDSSSNLKVRWDWENDGIWDTSWSRNKTATHTYPSAGQYIIKLEVKDLSGLTGQSTGQVSVTDDPPVTSALLAGSVGENGWYRSIVTLALTAYDDSGQLVWTKYKTEELSDWAPYSMPIAISGDGVHQIDYFSQDLAGHSEASKSLTVRVDKTAPTADGGADSSVDQASSVTFDGSSSSDNMGGVTSYSWSFVDETTKTLAGVKPTYVFKNVGVFAITLTVSDEAGNQAEDTVVVTVADKTSPVAEAGSDRSAEVGTAIDFNASGSVDNVGIVSYEWSFGDLGTANVMATTHEYLSPGTYTVTLTVKDAAGNQGIDSIVVTVTERTQDNDAESSSLILYGGVGVAVVAAACVVTALLLRGRK